MSKNRGQSDSRAAKRLTRTGRDFSNKKGVQLVVTKFINPMTGRLQIIKSKKILQYLKGKTIVHSQFV